MKCEYCKKEKFKEVYTYTDKIFCSKNCLDKYIKSIIQFIKVKDLVCENCDNNKRLFRCCVCNKIFCEDCIEEHKEEHINYFKIRNNTKIIGYKDYLKKEVVKNL